MNFFLPKRIVTFAVTILLISILVITLSSSHKTPSANQKISDISSIKHLLANPAYAAQVDFFLKLEGIPGESTDEKHTDEIELDSFQWGSLETGTQSHGSGGGAGKVKFNELHITKHVDKASPKLFLACANGKHIKTGVLTARKAGGEQDFLILTFSDLSCSSFQQKGDQQDLIPEDSISLNFSKVTFDFHPQSPSPTGTASALETATVDFNADTSTDTSQ